MKTVRLTAAQAIVRYVVAQRTVIDGEEAPLVPSAFAIFGHGNVLGRRRHLPEPDPRPGVAAGRAFRRPCDGFSCMGYEVAGAWGARMARRSGEWTEGGAFSEVRVPEESDREEVRAARTELLEAKQRQRVGW